MKYLAWLLKAAIFFVLFAFALNNQGPVVLHLFFGAQWQAPLVLVLLAAMTVGIFLGIAVMLPIWLRARRARADALSSGRGAPPSSAGTPPDTSPHGI